MLMQQRQKVIELKSIKTKAKQGEWNYGKNFKLNLQFASF